MEAPKIDVCFISKVYVKLSNSHIKTTIKWKRVGIWGQKLQDGVLIVPLSSYVV